MKASRLIRTLTAGTYSYRHDAHIYKQMGVAASTILALLSAESTRIAGVSMMHLPKKALCSTLKVMKSYSNIVTTGLKPGDINFGRNFSRIMVTRPDKP